MKQQKHTKADLKAVEFEPMHLTAQAKKELEEKLAHLKHVLPDYAAETTRTAAYGDRSENAEYQDTKARLRRTQRQIWTIEDQLKRAVIIRSGPSSSGKVQLGSTVLLEFENGTKKEFQILGPHEADPSKGCISNESPLGKALLHRKKNDSIILRTEIGEQKLKILEVK